MHKASRKKGPIKSTIKSNATFELVVCEGFDDDNYAMVKFSKSQEKRRGGGSLGRLEVPNQYPKRETPTAHTPNEPAVSGMRITTSIYLTCKALMAMSKVVAQRLHKQSQTFHVRY